MTRRTVFPLMAGALLTPLAAYAGAKEDARKAAEAWLALVDAGDYADSWDAGASAFQEQISKEKWAAAVGGVRGPLGAVKSRQFVGAVEKTSLPNGVEGHFVIIQYATEFANRDATIETVTPMEDTDGTWRVSGYYVRAQ